MLKVVKIGGNIVDNPEKLDRFLVDFASLPEPKILVHGGGKVATTVAKALGIETQMVGGRRVTDAETLKVVTMVYAGLINKTIVSKLQAGCNAVGLSGADGGFIRSQRRNPVPVDYGWVGDPLPDRFGLPMARTLIDAGYTVVAAPITLDAAGEGLLNTNADTVAQTIAVGMSGVYDTELVYCFEKKGVLRNADDDDNSVIPEITPQRFAELKAAGVVADGMLPKLENAFRAIDNGVRSVVICSAEALTEPGYGGARLCR